MSPDQIVEQLAKLDVLITRRTLFNYEKWGLIPKPERGGGGTGGRYTEYPANTVVEAYVAWTLMNGQYGSDDYVGKKPSFTPEIVHEARNFYLRHKRLGDGSSFSQRNIQRTQEIFKTIMAADLDDTQKVRQIESMIDLRIYQIIMETWELQYTKAQLLIKMLDN